MIALFVGCSGPKPIVWYCRTYNLPNHRHYGVDDTADRGWSRVHESLGSCVRWRVDAEMPTAERLRDVDLVVILNPEAESWEGGPAPHLMSDEEVGLLADYVEGGGALLFMSNQDEKHNIEKPRTNRLLERCGMRMRQGDIGLKILDIAEETPVVGGLCWRFFFGSPVELVEGAAAQAQVWAWNDPDAPTPEGEPGERVPLMAAAEVGAGRVIVVGDSGWTANGTIGLDDNWPILWRQIRWLTHDRLGQAPPALAPWTPPPSQ